MNGEPPVWGGGAAEGPGWSVLMAWTGLVLGGAALVFAFAAPLGAQPAGIVWVAAFGALAIWFGVAGGRRGRDGEGRRVSSVAGLVGAAFGALTLAVMLYAWLAVMLGGLPVLPAWETPADVPIAPFTEV